MTAGSTSDAHVRVRPLDGIPSADWDARARSRRSPWQETWLARLQTGFGSRATFLQAERGGRVAGGLVLYFDGSRRFPFADRWFARTARVFDEPFLVEDDPTVLDALVAAAEDHARAAKAVTLGFRVELPQRLAGADLERRGYRVRPHGVAVLDLRSGGDFEENFDHSTRKQIKKAVRGGIEIRVADGVEPLLPLLDASFTRSRLATRNHEYVRQLREAIGGEVLVASRGGTDYAALLWAVAGEVALNLLHGRADGDLQGAAHLLHREMIARAAARGAALIHTGGAALEGEPERGIGGITRFKKNLGFEVRTAFEGRKVLRRGAALLREAALGTWARKAGRSGVR